MYFNQIEFGRRIKELRTQKAMTQEELAGKLNIGYVHMNSIERGKKGCSIDLLLEISELFDVSTDYLLTGRIRSSGEVKGRLQAVMEEMADLIRKIDEE